MQWLTARGLLSRIQLRIIAATAAVLVLASSCAVRQPEQVEGTWVVTEALNTSTSAMSSNQAKQWLGQSYHYGAEQLILGQIQCQSPTYKKEQLDKSEFEQQFHVPLATLGKGLTDVDTFSIECNRGASIPGQTVFLTGHHEAYILWDGVFFKLEKTDTLAKAPL